MKFKVSSRHFMYKEDGTPFTFSQDSEGYELRLFGRWNYGGPKTETHVSWAVALMTAFGALYINKTQGFGLILGSLLTQDYIIGPRYPTGHGSSWVWSTLLGYNLYHYLLKRNNSIPVWLATWSGSGTSAWLVWYESYLNEARAEHVFHVGGQQTGFILAAILDNMFGSGKVTFNLTPRFLTLLGMLLPMLKGEYNATQLQKKVNAILAAHPHISQRNLIRRLGQD